MGLFNYCRQYIPDFASITSPLIDLYKGGKPGMEQINWTPEAEEAFTSMKEKLTSAPALGLPDGRLPFHLWTRVGDETYSAVLCQKPGDRYRPVGYFSTKIPVTMIGQPRCIQALDGATWAVDAVENLIGAQTIILHTPHSIVTLLNNTNIKTITDARRAKWEATLLNKDLRVEIIRDTSLNPATMMIEPHEGTPHECEKQVEEESLGPVSPTPLENPDKELWVDGSSYYVDGKRHTGWAVVEADGNVVKKGALSGHFSAQVAELIALAEAFELSEGQRVNIYTDSRYAFGVVHDYLALWKKRGLITSNGSEIQHASIIRRLIAACHLPREAAVIKVKSHQSDKSKESQGNTAADAVAREAALLPLTPVTLVQENSEDNPELRLLSYQTETDEEKEQWIKAGAKEDDQGIWRIPTGQVVMPIGTRRELMQLYHGKVHAGAKAMKAQISETWWWPRMMRDIDDYCRRCLIRAMVLPPDAPPPAGTGGDSTLFQEKLRRYLAMLDKAIKDNNKKVREAQQQWDEKHTTTDIPHIPELGSFVMVKRIPRKGLEPRWEGPYEVLLTTDTSVCLKGKGVGTDRWYHWSQVKPCLVNEQNDEGLGPEIEHCSLINFGKKE
ncbi:protein NYNRIN-like [Pimephales promelas]|uniref:protein NYNRIN-like n=1 Tax=Pimephales promelas TaxID=90988 RepID=UPI001955C5CD|nr:protein NYNRIN-like [Pimephales promelas]